MLDRIYLHPVTDRIQMNLQDHWIWQIILASTKLLALWVQFSIDDILKYFSYFSKNKKKEIKKKKKKNRIDISCKQPLSIGNSLHEMSNPVFEKKLD